MPQLTLEQAFAQAMQYHQRGQAREAEMLYRRIIAAQPRHADAHHLLGLLTYQSGNADEGIRLIRRAIELQPGVAAYHSNLGNMLAQLGRAPEAIVECRRAIALDPQLAAAHNNLGISLAFLKQPDEAIDSYERALAIQPDYAEALNNLGNAQRDNGLLEQSLATLRRARQLAPDIESNHHDYLFTLNYHPDYDAHAIYAEIREWADQYAPSLPPPKYRNDPNPNRRLRIAYLCANYSRHVHAYFHGPLLTFHDRQQVEVFGYSMVETPDDVTTALQALCDHWRPIHGLPDEQVAQMIQADRIDILVDEIMHMRDNRLSMYPRKPAPVQMTWLAYPGTTGLRAIDYRITDPYLDPPGTEAGKYSEQSIRLPETYLCYGPTIFEPLNDLPAARNGFITFGCLNTFVKVNDRVLALWARLLTRLPTARLILMTPEGRARQRGMTFFERAGINADRIEYVPPQSHQQYMATYHRIDIALDTFPFNGYTTSLDSLFMGVPVVTLVGDRAVGRGTWSALNNLKLTDLAAHDEDGFLDLVCRLASDIPRLAELRATLRDRMKNSPLMDAKRFARNLEALYRDVWRRWCERQRSSPPAPSDAGREIS